MKRVLCAVVIIAAAAGSSAFAHHSYSAYDTSRTIDIEGVLEDFEWIAPHSLLKVRADDARVYTAEWRAPIGLERAGIQRDTLKKGERVVITGNPHRDIDANGVVNLKSVRRMADGWKWAASS